MSGFINIYADEQKCVLSYKHLRAQKTYLKRGYANQDRCGQIVNRVDIKYCPIVANNRERMVDFEGDTVIAKGHKGALVTLVDRAMRETQIRALQNRLPENVSQACIEMLYMENLHAITFDNSKEFARQQAIAKALNAVIYSTKPYHILESVALMSILMV